MTEHNNYHHYIVVYYLESAVDLQIGKLGEFNFPPGYYLYVGKDKRNIRERVARHISKKKNNRWHIDYLSKSVMPVFMQIIPDASSECSLIEKLIELGGNAIASGFGSSDCQCKSHLLYYSELPWEKLLQVVGRS